MRYWAIIVAAGDGSRLGHRLRKAAVELGGKSIAALSTEAVIADSSCAGAVLVVHSDDLAEANRWLDSIEKGSLEIHLAVGGSSRRESVSNGFSVLEAMADAADLVAIHDGARPLLHREDLRQVLSVADETGAALLAEAVTDTLHHGDKDSSWFGFVDRDRLWHAQTPQIFRYSDLAEGLQSESEKTSESGRETDEVAAVVANGQPVHFVQARHPNLKITTPADLQLAQLLIESRLA
ncbi:MAG: hypothetical protein CBC13_10085 [Planctomycetia bacterium TMED53]|nr:MAG: hypothetical protein CBC13_10085 [Planctomycetia bacterium TMED53]